jgi:hypothetical protein
VRAEERRHRRGDVLTWAGALLLGAALAWIVLSIQGLNHDLRVSNEARDALARQVQGLGETPVAGPPGSRGEPGESVIGPSGEPGRDGRDGVDGKDAPTITPSPGPPGKDGKDGADSKVPGPTGAVGPPGADSTVPGPSGPPGADGRDGVDGADGTDGSPPAGWTFEYRNVTYTCRPADGFDPSSPQYECDGSEPSQDEEDSGQNPLAMGLDPSRRQF